jgi:hypothetical protein
MLLAVSIARNLICVRRHSTAGKCDESAMVYVSASMDWRSQNVRQLFLINHHRSFSLRRTFFDFINQFAADAMNVATRT